MALLLFTTPLATTVSSPSSTSLPKSHSFVRLCTNSIALHSKPFVTSGIRAPLVQNTRGLRIVKVSADVDGVGSSDPEPAASTPESKAETVSVENLPLESRAKKPLTEQQIKMRLEKKIRLRRKRLVRKRHLRKKGRWPPSKLKKGKNV